jgi:hypothetical protein
MFGTTKSALLLLVVLRSLKNQRFSGVLAASFTP